MSRTEELLETLIAFESLPRQSNLALMGWVRGLLAEAGAEIVEIPYRDGQVNLWARIGPALPGGIMLSGHVDVVPVEGQAWTRPPFRLTREGERLFGRGTTDMKGFVAAMLAAAERAGRAGAMSAPLHLAISCDEEIGCLGVRPMIDHLHEAAPAPALVIVGEPTSLEVVTGHKAKMSLRAVCHGREGHSALAPHALNALHLAADLVGAVRALQEELAAGGPRDPAYDVPFSTLHVGVLKGGTALNIVPQTAEMEIEIRALPEDRTEPLLARLRDAAAAIVAATADPDAAIEIIETGSYPGLDMATDRPGVHLALDLARKNATGKVAYGTEAGLFAEGLGCDVVVCGPGDMAQGHKPDEFVTRAQLAACDALLDRVIARLA